jgi:hypothetical protein
MVEKVTSAQGSAKKNPEPRTLLLNNSPKRIVSFCLRNALAWCTPRRKQRGLKMTSKKISLLVLASYLSSFSAMAAAPVASPEHVMLQSIIALQGKNLSQNDIQTQSSSVISKYLAVAPQDGQQARLEQAFVDLGIYTADQAHSYVADAQKAAAQASSKDTMATEIVQLAAHHPAGAQFSYSLGFLDINDCTVGIGLAVVGAAALIYGADEYSNNPTCTTPTESGTGYDPKTGDYVDVTIATGPTTCTKQNYYPHRSAATTSLAVGGVVAAVGGLLAWETCGYDGY